MVKGKTTLQILLPIKIEGFSKQYSVLDVGCAYGDLMDFLIKEGWRGKYTGVDIVPKLIEISKIKYPQIDTRLIDILEDEFNENFDWVFSSGALTSVTETEDNYDYFDKMLGKMFYLCKKGVAVNFCSPFVQFKSEINFHPQLDN